MIERELRTPQLNLLLCKLIATEEGKVVLELKNGKRIEQLPMEVFLAEIKNFADDSNTKLHIRIE